MKTDERNKFAIKSFLGEYLDLRKDKDNELATVDSIRKGVEFKGANLWILIFAIFMASLGLNVNSTAVIIGAMLISPLMGPIMGVGLSVGLNDFELMKRSLKSFLITTAFSVTSIGTLMYMIEGTQPNSQFNNIPNSIYWAIVTMTTVGYGDITPVTGLGKFLSACVMLIGYTIIAVPTGIVSASMMKDYKRRRDKECPNCHRSGHEDNAEFCKYCGHHLNPSETDVEKK